MTLKRAAANILGIAVGIVAFATLTLPLLYLSGAMGLLVRLSVECTKCMMHIVGSIPPPG